MYECMYIGRQGVDTTEYEIKFVRMYVCMYAAFTSNSMPLSPPGASSAKASRSDGPIGK